MSGRVPLRIAVVGSFLNSRGSVAALVGYYRAALRAGHDLRASAFGYLDDAVRQIIPVADTEWQPDLMILLFESFPSMSPETVEHIERVVPRARRLVVDCDAAYSPPARSGSDTNHVDPGSRIYCVELFSRLSDTILQPCLGPLPIGVQKFLFYGVDAEQRRAGQTGSEKTYDIAYVGTNWCRWHDISWLCKGLAPVRSELARLAVFGSWWDGTFPSYPLIPEIKKFHYSDPAFLLDHGVEIYPAVPFAEVEQAMGRARLHPLLLRPVLNSLRFVTPRMFETFMANTVPILPPYFKHAISLYGPDVTPLYVGYRPAEAVIEILSHYEDYFALAREIGAKLAKDHSYDRRLAELLSLSGHDSDVSRQGQAKSQPGSKDIMSPENGLLLGGGWYPRETHAGDTFRWVNNDAELVTLQPFAAARQLRLEIEPGPGLGGKPFLLQFVNERGEAISSTPVHGRESVSVELAVSESTVRVFRLHVDGGGLPTPNDSRTLNFRVFAIE